MRQSGVNLEQLRRHVVQVVYHFLPPLVLEDERTRLGIFAEEVRRRFPQLYVWTQLGPDGLRISPRPRTVAAATLDTLQVQENNLRLTFPIQDTSSPADAALFTPDYRPVAEEVRGLFFRHIIGRRIMRADCIRHVGFEMTRDSVLAFVTSRHGLGAMSLTSASLTEHFRDQSCQISIEMSPRRASGKAKQAADPWAIELTGELAVGVTVHGAEGSSPPDEEAIGGVFDRTEGLWPEMLLDYLNGTKE